MTHLGQNLWETEEDGQEYIHVLWGDVVYTGKVGKNCVMFSAQVLPEGVHKLLHDWFFIPPPNPDYTLAA